MARRSAQNPRYRKDSQVGSTRKSAASAKPKRAAGEVKSHSSAGKGGTKKKSVRIMDPDTPEFRRWRKIWLGLLIAAIIFSLAAYGLRDQKTVNTLSLAFAYSCLFSAFFIDLTKIRRMRREYMEGLDGGKKKAAKAEDSAADVEVSVDVKVKSANAVADSENGTPDEGKAD
ncbi:MAG: hypothetical protein L6413_05075 [Coriobacteriia bacterium]|nr:hypothetical protein [Coriobacteriia bacterium]